MPTHAENAENLISEAASTVLRQGPTSQAAAAYSSMALVEATLAVAEQQRIANLIALAHRTSSLGEELEILCDEAAEALMESERTPATPFSGPDDVFRFRREIAIALGIRKNG